VHGEAIIRAVAARRSRAAARRRRADRAAEAVLDGSSGSAARWPLTLDISGEVALPFAATCSTARSRAGAPVLAAVGTEPLSPV
jgi:hypothetical protein